MYAILRIVLILSVGYIIHKENKKQWKNDEIVLKMWENQILWEKESKTN